MASSISGMTDISVDLNLVPLAASGDLDCFKFKSYNSQAPESTEYSA